MVFYFTATGNSLYVAKHLDDELLSIPQELNKTNRHYKADRIGIICPLFEFEIPALVKRFICDSEFETNYFYVVVTYGCHHGGVAERTQDFLKSIGREANYININAVAPGATVTPAHLANKAGEQPGGAKMLEYSRHFVYFPGPECDPMDQANACLFLASDMGKHVKGQVIQVCNGAFL